MTRSNINSIIRNHLLTADLGKKEITKVQIDYVTLKGGQSGGRHLHPCPVVGYILAGTAIMQIEQEPLCVLQCGEAFYEPAEMHISEFGNYSETEELCFVAIYLLNGDQETIKLL